MILRGELSDQSHDRLRCEGTFTHTISILDFMRFSFSGSQLSPDPDGRCRWLGSWHGTARSDAITRQRDGADYTRLYMRGLRPFTLTRNPRAAT